MTDFNHIVGHEALIDQLQNAIQLKKVSHAYILLGEKGMGKHMLAGVFAKTLQCEAGGKIPCNSCTSCRLKDSGNHPDIKMVVMTNKTRLGVDDIREQINTDIYVKPYQNPYKIYIIEEADKMTDQAQNALLKTMEEPPGYGVLILLAENLGRFLPTVLSRCVVLPMREVSLLKIKDFLIRTENLPQDQADRLASFARGNIGKARMLIHSVEFEEIRNDILRTFELMIEEKRFEVLEMAQKLAEYKEDTAMVTDILLTWIRDLLLLKETGEEKWLIHKDQYKTLLKQSAVLSYNRLSEFLARLEEMQRNMRVNVSIQLSLETLF